MADVNNPPPGGFEEGGWYWNPSLGEAQQYWGGSFGAGTTVANPNQAGYGQRVSQEVQTQSGYVAPEPKSSGQVTPYLNQYQSNLYSDRPEIKVPTMEELKTTLTPAGGYPEDLNRVEKFEELRTDQGVEALETTLNDLKAQEEQAYANLRIRKAGEEGKPVAMGVISGRITEVEKQERENLDFIQRQKARVVDELNTKYNVINMYMNFYGLDYQDSVNRYNTEFQQNLDMYQIIIGRQDAQMEAWEKDRANASANLTLMMNAITAGNLDYGSMSADQKVQIAKLEAQAGIPVGTMASVKMDADANIVFTTSNEGVTQIGIRNADGTISVQKYGERISSGGGATEKQQYYVNMAKDDARTGVTLSQMLQIYGGYLTSDEIYQLYNQNSMYGTAKESPEELAKYGIKTIKTEL